MFFGVLRWCCNTPVCAVCSNAVGIANMLLTLVGRVLQAAAGAGGGLSRAKSGHLDRAHTVQLLDETEQANLFKNTHQKHGWVGM